MTANKCPHCGGEINPASILASVTSEAKATAARENGKKGGRPNRALATQEPRDKEVGR